MCADRNCANTLRSNCLGVGCWLAPQTSQLRVTLMLMSILLLLLLFLVVVVTLVVVVADDDDDVT